MSPIYPGQFRLSRIQLINWGTFSGYVDMPIARRGHLITGGSGSGKSTLLDAMAAIGESIRAYATGLPRDAGTVS